MRLAVAPTSCPNAALHSIALCQPSSTLRIAQNSKMCYFANSGSTRTSTTTPLTRTTAAARQMEWQTLKVHFGLAAASVLGILDTPRHALSQDLPVVTSTIVAGENVI